MRWISSLSETPYCIRENRTCSLGGGRRPARERASSDPIIADPNIDVLCSDRKTQQAEDIIRRSGRFYFERIFSNHEQGYDAVIIEVVLSLTLLQTCAMVYTKQILVPVATETLSVQGAAARIRAGNSLKRKPDISVVGLSPVIVDRRLQMPDILLNTLEELSERDGVPILPTMRTDTAVVKAGRHKRFLVEFDPKSKALEDYTKATDKLLEILPERADAATAVQSETTQEQN